MERDGLEIKMQGIRDALKNLGVFGWVLSAFGSRLNVFLFLQMETLCSNDSLVNIPWLREFVIMFKIGYNDITIDCNGARIVLYACVNS